MVAGLLFGPTSPLYEITVKLLLAQVEMHVRPQLLRHGNRTCSLIQICLSLVAGASGMSLFMSERGLYYHERGAGTSALAYFVAKNLAHFPLAELQVQYKA